MNELGFRIVRNLNESPFITPESIHKETIFDQMVYWFVKDFESRLTKYEENSYRIFKFLPKHAHTISDVDIKEIIHFYGDIIDEKPNSTTEEVLKFEVENFRTITEQEGLKEEYDISSILKKIPEHLTLIRELYKIMPTLPVSNASGERAFSVLKLIKTRLRSVIGEKRLSAITRANSVKHICVTEEEILVKFATEKSRRLNFFYS